MFVPRCFGCKVRFRTFGCAAIGSALLFILRSRLLFYCAGSGVNGVQVVLSGLSVSKQNCMKVWLYVFLGCTRACVCRCDGDVFCVGHGLNPCSGGGMSAV